MAIAEVLNVVRAVRAETLAETNVKLLRSRLDELLTLADRVTEASPRSLTVTKEMRGLLKQIQTELIRGKTVLNAPQDLSRVQAVLRSPVDFGNLSELQAWMSCLDFVTHELKRSSLPATPREVQIMLGSVLLVAGLGIYTELMQTHSASTCARAHGS